jgi:hypothetical protein
MAHANNPNYSGGRDQEDGGSKPVQGNSSRDSILKKNPSQKKGLVKWLQVYVLNSSTPPPTPERLTFIYLFFNF